MNRRFALIAIAHTTPHARAQRDEDRILLQLYLERLDMRDIEPMVVPAVYILHLPTIQQQGVAVKTHSVGSSLFPDRCAIRHNFVCSRLFLPVDRKSPRMKSSH